MKKFLPYILIILIALVGFFGVASVVKAQTLGPKGTCTTKDPTGNIVDWKDQLETNCPPSGTGNLTKVKWVQNGGKEGVSGACMDTRTSPPRQIDLGGYDACIEQINKGLPYVWDPMVNATSGVATMEDKDKASFENWAKEESCGIIGSSSVSGCVKALFYYVVYLPAAILLAIAAVFFNALIPMSLSSALFSNSGFIPPAWAVVRDLSNIFFILILLYVAIKIILDLGAGDAKKTIARVVIIALLINFSMFFTQVVIDTSNVLALVFYNKLDTKYKDPKTGAMLDRNYKGSTGAGEKDLSGSMYNGFDVTKKIDAGFWEQTKKDGHIPVGIMVGVILIAAGIMIFAAYAFFISGIAFVARMIELFILIIFSPFAFMSFTISELAGIEYLGWTSWLKRLLTAAFMAPIFMFFMYLIFLLLNADLFGALVPNQADWPQKLLGFIIPGMLIIILLLQATKYAKKGSGIIGEKLMSGAKTVGGMVGGFALGAATGGAALLATNTLGARNQRIANDDNLKARAASGDAKAQRKLDNANYWASKSFDFRQTGLGKFAAKKSGMDFNKGTGIIGIGTEKLKGGRVEQTSRKVKEEQERRKTYLMSGDTAKKQDARNDEYEKDKSTAEAYAKKYNLGFSADQFKKDYVKGGFIKYGLNKEVGGGIVESSKTINTNRKQAFEISQRNSARGVEERGILKTFLGESGGEIKKMYTTKSGLLQTAAMGAVGGLGGAIVGPLGLSLARAIKTTVAKKSFGDVRATDAEVIAKTGSERTRKEQIADMLEEEVTEKEKNKSKEEKPEPAPSAPVSAVGSAHVSGAAPTSGAVAAASIATALGGSGQAQGGAQVGTAGSSVDLAAASVPRTRTIGFNPNRDSQQTQARDATRIYAEGKEMSASAASLDALTKELRERGTMQNGSIETSSPETTQTQPATPTTTKTSVNEEPLNANIIGFGIKPLKKLAQAVEGATQSGMKDGVIGFKRATSQAFTDKQQAEIPQKGKVEIKTADSPQEKPIAAEQPKTTGKEDENPK